MVGLSSPAGNSLMAATDSDTNSDVDLAALPVPDPAVERARLVRLCARLTGDFDAAEDLAQDALLIGHRRVDHLLTLGPDARWPWLAATARNLCLHWRRDRGREWRHTAHPSRLSGSIDAAGSGGSGAASTDTADDLLETIPDNVDLAVELERAELATLLDRAMSLLPPDTRRVLIEHYVEDSPQAQTAVRLGLSDGSVAMRLQRGRLALRRILTTELREDAIAFGLVDPERVEFHATQIWCPLCGTRRLWGRFGPDGYLHVVCRGCFGRREYCIIEGRFGALLDGTRSFGLAYTRVQKDFHQEFRHGIGGRLVRCPRCGTGAPLEVSPARGAAFREVRRACPHCGPVSGPGSVAGLTSCSPEGRAFRHTHRRIRTLPEREVTYGARPALLSTLESVTSGACLEVVFARDTLEPLAVSGAPQNP